MLNICQLCKRNVKEVGRCNVHYFGTQKMRICKSCTLIIRRKRMFEKSIGLNEDKIKMVEDEERNKIIQNNI